MKINIIRFQLKTISLKSICAILFFVIFLGNCANKNYPGIRNKEFISKRNSPKIIGEISLKLSKSEFEFKNNEQAVWGNAEPNVIGYSGEYKIEGEKLILNTQKVICCKKFVENFEKEKDKEEGIQIKGSRYVDCSYENYDVNYLTEIGLNYKDYCLDTFEIENSNGQVKLINNRIEFKKKEKHNR